MGCCNAIETQRKEINRSSKEKVIIKQIKDNIIKGDLIEVKRLVNNKEIKIDMDQNFLLQAVENQKFPIVKFLIANGADVDNSYKILRKALELKNKHIFHFLVRKGANINHISPYKIHRLYLYREYKLLYRILDYGFDLNREYGTACYNNTTILEQVIRGNDIKIDILTKLIQDYGMDVNKKGTTYPLHTLIENNRQTKLIQKFLDILFKNGCDPNVTVEGRSAVTLFKRFSERSQLTFLKKFINNGYNIHLDKKPSLLYKALTKWKNRSVFRYLLRQKNFLLSKIDSNEVAKIVDILVQENYYKELGLIVNTGYDINNKDANGDTIPIRLTEYLYYEQNYNESWLKLMGQFIKENNYSLNICNNENKSVLDYITDSSYRTKIIIIDMDSKS